MLEQAITIPEYAKKRGVSESAVKQAIERKTKLIGVSRYIKSGSTWILYYSNTVANKNLGKCIELTN